MFGEFLFAGLKIQQLGNRKMQTHLTAEQGILKPIRTPRFPIIRQYSQRGHPAVVAVENAVVVRIHAFGKAGFRLALHFHVYNHPGFFAAVEPKFHQLIH